MTFKAWPHRARREFASPLILPLVNSTVVTTPRRWICCHVIATCFGKCKTNRGRGHKFQCGQALRPNSQRIRNATHNATQANGTCCCQWECSHCTQARSKDLRSNLLCASYPASCVNCAQTNHRFLRSWSDNTAQSTLDACPQIRTQILWCCLHAVWILTFTSTGPICLRCACASCVNEALRSSQFDFFSVQDRNTVAPALFESASFETNPHTIWVGIHADICSSKQSKKHLHFQRNHPGRIDSNLAGTTVFLLTSMLTTYLTRTPR